ncbi:MAG: nucleoside 2-deoxyribosyltransferase domain-containing protein [Candidatus Saccharimonas sp.]
MIIKTLVSSNQDLIPDIFLAGGVTYSPDWQKEALKMLADTDLIVANPRRDELISAVGEMARRQIVWEFKNLKSTKVVLFWFPNAETIITFLELGKELARKSNIVVGVDPDYNRRFDIETQVYLESPDAVIYSTLGETVQAAARLCGKV